MKSLSEKDLVGIISEAIVSYLQPLNESVWLDEDNLEKELKNLFPDKQLNINVNGEIGEVIVEDEDTGDVWYGYGEEKEEYVPTGNPSPVDRDLEEFDTITVYDYNKTFSDLKTRIENDEPDKRGNIQTESFEITVDELRGVIKESVKRILNLQR